jgi:2-polyprenyl-3-methyl-5-hydroxy-6-metoxy-1,4-benzoquinol methylase
MRRTRSKFYRLFRHIYISFLKKNPRLYQRYLFRQQLKRLEKSVLAGENFLRTPSASKDEYDAYDEREQIQYFNSGWYCLVDGKVEYRSAKEIRDYYLQHVYDEIDALLDKKRKISVLEVGCGNCLNIWNIAKRYGDKVGLFGLDISEKRIRVAKEYFGSDLDGVRFYVRSIYDGDLSAVEGPFDLVFSMHCLEQIPYMLEPSLRNMYALCAEKLLMIEPTWEYASPAQKLYLLVADHAKVLLPTIEHLGYQIRKKMALRLQSSAKNQSTLIVIDK